jgi:hypothetical protein
MLCKMAGNIFMELSIYILKEEIRKVFLLHQNVCFKHVFGSRIFLCCFLNTSLVVRFREARLELVVEFEYKWKHHVFLQQC